MGLTETLARFVAETRYEEIPDEARTLARRAILDTLGVALAGSREEAGRIVAELAAQAGGAPEAGVLGMPLRLPAAEAALVNGTLGHALDYDDVSLSMVGHPSVPLLPGLLALGEKLRASGRQLIEAFVLGFEVECKVGRGLGPSHYARGWHATSTLGSLGAAAACGKLLGLDVEAMRIALGTATSLASGSRQNFGSMTKPLHAGHAARNGVLAALLAQRGFTADRDILDTPLGFGSLFAPEGDWDPEAVLSHLADPWDIVSPGIIVKKYPCCFAAHCALDAVLELMGRAPIAPHDVEQVEVSMPAGAAQPLVHSRPQTGLEGKFSVEYCLAAALLDGGVKLASFADRAVRRPEAQALLRRVRPSQGPGEAHRVLGGYARVAVVLKDGTRLEAQVDHPRGSPQAPLSGEELAGKYRDCAAVALPEGAVEESLRLLSDLDSLADISELMAVVCPAGRSPREADGGL